MPQKKPVLQKIKGLFLGQDAKTNTRVSDTRPQRSQAAGEGKVKTALALPSKLPAGTLQIIGLTKVRSSLGDRWDATREKSYRVVESTLGRRLTPADTYYRIDEENYLVLFTRLGRKEAEFKAGVITREIEGLLLGELGSATPLALASSVAEVDRTVVLEQVSTLNELLDHIRNAQPPAAESEGIVLFDGDAEAAIQEETVRYHGPGPDFADLDQSLSGLFKKKSCASFLKECEAGFFPSFSLRRRSFSFYDVTVLHRASGVEAHAVNDPLLEDPDGLSFYLDRYVLVSGLLGLHRMISAGKNGIIVMRVSFRTMATGKLRDVYLTRLKEIPSGLARNLAISICDIPDGTPSSRLSDVMTYLTPYCKTRIISIRPDPGLVDLYAETGAHAFATTLPKEQVGVAKLYQRLAHFAKRAAWHKRESILHRTESQSDLEVAATAGISFVSGPIVAPILDTPGLQTDLASQHIPVRPVAGAAG